MQKILIIEDDRDILKLLAGDLELEGYVVLTATDGLTGLELSRTNAPNLLILDLMLPGMNGYDVCRTLRKEGSDVPIIMLTARGQENDKVVGLDYGADDYVTKPYGAMELIARVKAHLRRQKRELKRIETVAFDDVEVSFNKKEARKKGKLLPLTAKEFQVLELLVRHRGEVVTRQQFLEEVWGYDELPSTRTVDTRILLLRQKLSPRNPEAYIETAHGIGYKLVV